MRTAFGIVFEVLIAALLVCIVLARRTKKPIGRYTALLDASLIPPIIGNLILVVSGRELISTIGYYIYFLGMDLVMFALFRFTIAYCRIPARKTQLQSVAFILLTVDAVQLLLNPVFGHAFGTEVLHDVYGFDYYHLLPYAGQTFHRIVDYSILALIMGAYVFEIVHTPKLYSERYWVILLVMVVVTVWESAYIFSGTPLDRSMIGFGVFGLLIFYFSLYHRPMRLLDRMLAGVASDMSDSMFFFDASGQCLWLNRSASELLHLEPNHYEKARQRLEDLFGIYQRPVSEWNSRVTVGTGEDARHYSLRSREMQDSRGRDKAGTFLIVHDFTPEERDTEQRLYQARHDRLTGFYTRDYLYECAHRMLQEHPETEYVAIYLDIDNFKIVNDLFGYDFGDFTLKTVAEWIRGAIPEGGIHGRLYGDAFGLFVPAGTIDIEEANHRLAEFRVNDGKVEHPILIHAGVYRVQDRDLDVTVMFDRAHMALTTVKNNYQQLIAFYSDDMRNQVLWNRRVSGELETALQEKQFVPYLQPIVDTEGRTVGAEVLVRWLHPTDGLRAPFSFIPVFEKNGMIAQLDRYMWRRACEILAGWQKEGRQLFLSVNVSPRDFYYMDIPAEFTSLIREYAIDPTLLRIEITESAMMNEPEKGMAVLRALHADGFTVEIDDFGSGYSSLNMLNEMPVDILKIDMVFLRKTVNVDRTRTIVKHIISMSEEMGIIPLTEGVETGYQFGKLKEMGCRLYQGYYFAQPMPVTEFEQKYLSQ